MELTKRQKNIVEIIKSKGSITGEEIGELLGLTRSALRSDFMVLTNLGIIISKKRVGYVINKEVESSKRVISCDIKVREIMSRAVNIDENRSVYDAVVTMFEKDVGSLFITSEGYLAGVVSRKDLLKVSIGKRDMSSIPIHLIMTRMPNVIFAYEDDLAKKAAMDLVKHEIDSLPVVKKIVTNSEEEEYEIVGRFTKTNITKLFIKMV